MQAGPPNAHSVGTNHPGKASEGRRTSLWLPRRPLSSKPNGHSSSRCCRPGGVERAGRYTTTAECSAASCGWRGPAALGERCSKSTLTSRLLTDDGGLGKSGMCGSVSFGRWDGKSYPDRRPNLTSDAVGTVQRIEKVAAWPNRAEAANYGS